MSTPKYGELAPPPAPESKTKNVYEAATNEHDVAVAREDAKRTLTRTVGTVAVFAVIMSPVIIAMLRMVPQ